MESESDILVSNTDDSIIEIIPRKHRRYPIDLGLTLFFFAYELSSAVLTNQIVFQTCNVELGYNKSDCIKLGTHNESNKTKELEIEVQHYVTKITLARNMIDSVVPAILSFFIGPWSDKYGRKPIILWSLFGYTFMYLSFTCFCFMSNVIPLTPWIYLIGTIFGSLCGGICSVITGSFAYISDVTKDVEREAR